MADSSIVGGEASGARASEAMALGSAQARAERHRHGRGTRRIVPRHAHGEWTPAPDRPDPIAVLEDQAKDRVPELVPVRYGRMMVSPFTYFRGAAGMMALDLSRTPNSRIMVQACGDAHLLNFGVYATPERNVVFDVNDFDETLPGPWEWDLKRLATSAEVAAREHGFQDDDRRSLVIDLVRSYAMRMRTYSQQRHLEVWYSKVDEQAALGVFSGNAQASAGKMLEKARLHDNLQAAHKLTRLTPDGSRIMEVPPVIQRMPDVDRDATRLRLARYRRSLSPDVRSLLARYHFVDAARKVVGVGSVGTRCSVVHLQGDDDSDPLFLQIKEAQASVLEPFLRKSRYENQGQRVVVGQWLMQAASDLFLGWSHYEGHFYYWRQLRDVKGSADLQAFDLDGFGSYLRLCGWTLARGHARTGDACAITGYVGRGDALPEAIADFSAGYADQMERDHQALVDAVRTGRVPAEHGV